MLRKVNKKASLLGIGIAAAIGALQSAQAYEAFSTTSPWMLGDWGGARTELLNDGYKFSANYVSELGTNAHGGYNNSKKLEYADQFAVGMHLDLQKILGVQDAEFQLLLNNRNGQDITGTRLDDPRSGQVGSNMEVVGGGQIWRLTQMWYRQKFFDQKLAVKFGRVSPTEDFQEFPCDFQDVAFCAAQAGVWASNDWSSYPISMWGANFRYSLTPEWLVQAGIYEHNRTNQEHDNGFKLSTSGSNGVILPVEVVWKPKSALFGLPGEYRLGAYHMNIDAEDVYKDIDGGAFRATGNAPKVENGRNGLWFIGRQQVGAFDNDSKRPVEVFIQAHANDKDTSFIDRFYSAGIVASGPFASRPQDQIAFGVARIHVNDRIRDGEKAMNQMSGATSYDDPAYMPLQGTQYDIELNYRIQATRSLSIRPNIQYIKNPGAVDEVSNALVLGVKTEISF
ncbi:carbohydrate porin [Pseudomonas syringae]|uniref:carbohydrate porin n=1 Tax=Pseudomonas syringae TaxID=317 RepID=UPI00215AAB33|nr:carbohydrate porin [Pseudomonas syringae]MCR8720606.1 carbohydrate porin [Pseudomonas syringae]